MTITEREIIIYYRPLPWFSADRLKSILSDLSGINNRLHLTGWKILSVTVDSSHNRIIIKGIPPQFAESGLSDLLIPVAVIGGLIIGAGLVITGSEIQFKQSVVKAVEQNKIPAELAEKIINTPKTTSSSSPASGITNLLSSIKPLVYSIVIILVLSLVMKLMGGVKLAG